MKRTRPASRAKIDWPQVHQRLLACAAGETSVPTPVQAQAILEERARALARAAAPPATEEVLELVTFHLAQERYAVETRHVRTVARFTEGVPVPGTPDFLCGVMNLRGTILTVFDLRKLFGIVTAEQSNRTRVLVLGGDRDEFGILADAVEEVVMLPISQVLEPPGSVAGIGREYLRGVTRDALIVLDGGVLLRDGRLTIDQAEEAST